MDVIGAGFGRTGTLSLKAALEQLGCGPCLHMLDVIGNPGQIAAWQAVLDGCETGWGKLLDGFRSAVDWPACTYYAELAATFPAARVVLTVRPAEAWYESMRYTIYAAFQAAVAGKLETSELPPPSPEYTRMIHELLWERTFSGRFGDRDHAIAVYQAHIAQVKETVPTERLLVFQVSEGWQPLARFLGVPAPARRSPGSTTPPRYAAWSACLRGEGARPATPRRCSSEPKAHRIAMATVVAEVKPPSGQATVRSRRSRSIRTVSAHTCSQMLSGDPDSRSRTALPR